jgi:hypothetical protein
VFNSVRLYFGADDWLAESNRKGNVENVEFKIGPIYVFGEKEAVHQFMASV